MRWGDEMIIPSRRLHDLTGAIGSGKCDPSLVPQRTQAGRRSQSVTARPSRRREVIRSGGWVIDIGE